MPNKLVGFVLKDINFNIAGNIRIGQCAEIVLPVIEEKMEELRNAGMIKAREVAMGYEKLEASFKEPVFDPSVMLQYGLASGGNKNIIAYGYLESEDGSEHEARAEMVARIKKFDPGTWAAGEKSETDYSIAVHDYKLWIDDDEIYAIDDFGVAIGGVMQQPGRRAALRLA